MRLVAVALVFAFLLVAGFPSSAQDFEVEEKAAFRKLMLEEFEALSIANPEEGDLIQLVETVLMVRLTQTLELDEQQTMRLVRRAGDYLDQIHRLKWLRQDKRNQLSKAMEQNAPKHEIEKRLHELLKIEQAIAELINDIVTISEKELTTDQAAKLYLFIGDFENEIQNLAERAIAMTQERHATEK